MASGVSYLSPAAFNFTLDAAAAANYRIRCFRGIVQVLIIFFKGH
jgi:hypothetical protein